jgi:hypothetical protein
MTFPNGGIRKEKVSSKMNKMDTTGYDSEGENKSEWGAGNFFRTFKGVEAGDSLLPLLFNLVADSLTTPIKKS